MENPDYEAVGKNRFEELKEGFKTADKQHLVSGIRGLFSGAEGELIYLKEARYISPGESLAGRGSRLVQGRVCRCPGLP